MAPRTSLHSTEPRRCASSSTQRGGLNLIVTHRRRAGLDRLLTTHGLADLFTDIVGDDDGYPRKPDPGALSTLIERHRLPRGETLAVGDRDIDILAAHAAGLAAAHFGTNPITTTPDVVLPDFGTLRRLDRDRVDSLRTVQPGAGAASSLPSR